MRRSSRSRSSHIRRGGDRGRAGRNYEGAPPCGLPSKVAARTSSRVAAGRCVFRDVDFNSDLQPGDWFEVLFGRVMREGHFSSQNVQAAAMSNEGRTLTAIRHQGPDGREAGMTPRVDRASAVPEIAAGFRAAGDAALVSALPSGAQHLSCASRWTTPPATARRWWRSRQEP